jgi:hypothetical protein
MHWPDIAQMRRLSGVIDIMMLPRRIDNAGSTATVLDRAPRVRHGNQRPALVIEDEAIAWIIRRGPTKYSEWPVPAPTLLQAVRGVF